MKNSVINKSIKTLDIIINILIIISIISIIYILFSGGILLNFFGISVSLRRISHPVFILTLLLFFKIFTNIRLRNTLTDFFISKKASFYFVLTLLIISLIIVTINILFPNLQIFNLDGEKNIASIFSGFIYLIVSFISVIIYFYENTKKIKNFRLWIPMFLGFLYLCIDEVTSIHEESTNYIKFDANNSILAFFDNAEWLAVYLPVIILSFIFFAYFIKKKLIQNKKALYTFLLGLGAFCFALSIEALELIMDLSNNLYRTYMITEESMELLGCMFILTSFIIYLQNMAIKQKSLLNKKL